ncbi:MAG: 3-hydroxyacyl-CoA dehydrogenase [Gemmatimonadetes bacterium]|jgi:carnitine 3-dehydrogenase|nr:3-hydroxyacyl-CoA dehydrogenase [Gemmatimonadota bacterium]
MKNEDLTVGIVGTGTIGASWAAFYASKGMEVRLFDSMVENRERGLILARKLLADMGRLGLMEGAVSGEAEERLSPVDSLEEMGETVAFVHEAAAENYEVKIELFTRLDEIAAPEVILASSSSGLLMTKIQESMRHPERALIAHPFNPPHLIPLVELVRGEKTGEEVVREMHAFFTSLGKMPVVLQKEVPGHIANRLAAALWREALDLVARGVASVEDVDRALCAGPGLRWALMGQHLIYHLGGGEGGYEHFIEHIGKGWRELWEDMPTWTEIPDEATKAAVAGMKEAVGDRDPAEIAAWRDEKLAALVREIYGESPELK